MFQSPSVSCRWPTFTAYVLVGSLRRPHFLTAEQRMVEMGVIGRGGAIGHWSGDPLRLLEDVQILKPTMFPTVPRILNRVYQAGMAAAQLPGVKGALFRRALETKLERLHTTGQTTHALWDRLVFNKVLLTHSLHMPACRLIGPSRRSEMRLVAECN